MAGTKLAPAEPLQRLKDVLDEVGKARRKIAVGRGVAGADGPGGDAYGFPGMEKELEELEKCVRDAAEAEAKRRIAQAKEEAERLRDGEPQAAPPDDRDKILEKIHMIIDRLLSPKGAGGEGDLVPIGGMLVPSGDPTAPPAEGGEGGGGAKYDCCCLIGALAALVGLLGGGGGGRGDIFVFNGGGGGAGGRGGRVQAAFPFGIQPGGRTIGDGGSREEPPAACVYVRSQTIIHCWNRRAQMWRSFDLGSEIVDVQIGGGGVLAVARTGAILFDCEIGEFLTPLGVRENLEEGEIA